jgi:hypothetical protein
MNIPNYKEKYDKGIKTCMHCTSDLTSNYHNSKNCIHKLCDNCFINHFLKNPKFICRLCNDRYFVEEPQDQNIYFRDYKIRKELFENYIYKRRDNFNTDEEYNDYLEEIENIIEEYLNKDMNELKISQNKVEHDTNKSKYNEILNLILKDRKSKSPIILYAPNYNTNYNNSKNLNNDNLMEIENNNIYETKIIREIKYPSYKPNAQINLIKDLNKRKNAGGYNEKNVYNDLTKYAFGGFN